MCSIEPIKRSYIDLYTQTNPQTFPKRDHCRSTNGSDEKYDLFFVKDNKSELHSKC